MWKRITKKWEPCPANAESILCLVNVIQHLLRCPLSKDMGCVFVICGFYYFIPTSTPVSLVKGKKPKIALLINITINLLFFVIVALTMPKYTRNMAAEKIVKEQNELRNSVVAFYGYKDKNGLRLFCIRDYQFSRYVDGVQEKMIIFNPADGTYEYTT